MVILGLLLIMGGALVILASIFGAEGTAEFLGEDVSALTLFLLGVAAGAAILWGYSILKWGTKRGLAHRKERKELNKLNERLDRAEAERRSDDSGPDEKI